MRLSNESYFSLNFIARKRQNKEGELPISLRITMNGQRAEIYINRSVRPDDWNASKGQSKGKTKICEIHNQLVMRDELVNPDVLKRAFLGKLEKPKMLCEAFREVNVKVREQYERGDICKATVLRWERCVVYLEEFLLGKENVNDIPMKKLTSGMVGKGA